MIYRFLREVVQAKYEEVGKDISNQWHFFSNDISNQWHLSTIHPNTLTGFYLLGSPIRICHASNCQLQKCCTPKMLSSDVGKPAVLNLQLLIQNFRQTMIKFYWALGMTSLPMFLINLNDHWLNFFLKKMGQLRPLILFIFGLFKQTLLQFLQVYGKKSIQYMVPELKPTTFRTWVSSHNLYTRAPTHHRLKF